MIKYLLIVNPESGKRKGPSVVDHIRPIFNIRDIELDEMETTMPGHAKEYVTEVNLSRYKAICVVGGDGTYHEVINGMLSRKDKAELPIGLIPAGTGNSLLTSLDILDPLAAVNAIINGSPQGCDLAQLTSAKGTVYSFNVIGWGVSNDVNILAEKLRWFKGQRYNVAAIIEILRNRSRFAKITFEDQIIEGQFSFLAACNTKYSGNGMKIAPEAEIDDGLIDLLLVRKLSRLKLMRIFLKIFSGTHLPNPYIVHHRVSEFKVECDFSFPLTVDGETCASAPFSVKVLPKRIKIFRQ